MTPAAERVAALVAVAGGGATVAAAGGQDWRSGSEPPAPGLPAVAEAVTGPAGVVALGLVLLAAAVALLVSDGLLRRLVGVIAVLAATAVCVYVALWQPAGTGGGTGGGASPGDLAGALPSTVWPAVAAAGAVLAGAGGVLAAARGHTWSRASRRYERAAGAPETSADRPPGEKPSPQGVEAGEDQRRAWDAMARGEDPTA